MKIEMTILVDKKKNLPGIYFSYRQVANGVDPFYKCSCVYFHEFEKNYVVIPDKFLPIHIRNSMVKFCNRMKLKYSGVSL